MGSIHFWASDPEEELWDFRNPWCMGRLSALDLLEEPDRVTVPVGRELTGEELEAIRRLSRDLEGRTHAWMDRVNGDGSWKRYHSRTMERWHEDLWEDWGREDDEPEGLYLDPGPEGLFCTGIDEAEGAFFGFMNLDDVETNFKVTHFLREYVRRLSILVPDMMWMFDHDG